MKGLAIIGGTGLTDIEGLHVMDQKKMITPYGDPSGPLALGEYAGCQITFLPRHGNPHVIPPHKINYRANLHALFEFGIDTILAVNAVGGITDSMQPGKLVIPDQIIDYTWGRKHTFFEDDIEKVNHIDFTIPYSEKLRRILISTAKENKQDLITKATYGATQGPRLETAAEIDRMENDGCDIVGMTGMPEAGLAKELGFDYASICIIANRAAGKSDEPITMEMIDKNMQTGLNQTCRLLEMVIPKIVC